ncbi:transporter substrate-binding domain-containing protein [bacterium]|nr:transporter substrate-binding domain-containing protein [bacterium]
MTCAPVMFCALGAAAAAWAAPAAPARPAGDAPSAERRTIVVGVNTDYPPFEYQESGAPTGFDVEVVREAAAATGLDVQFRADDWCRMRPELEDGRIDALAGMLYSSERATRVDFTVPYMVVHYAVFARAGGPSIAGPQDLRGRRVLVESGSMAHDLLAAGADGAVIVPVESEPQALRLLASGRGDAAIAPNAYGPTLAKRLGLGGVFPVGPPFSSFELRIAVRKGDQALAARLDEGLATLRASGRLQALTDKWFGVLEPRGASFGQTLRHGAMVVAPLLALLAAAFVWTWSLRRRVRRRTRDLRQELDRRKAAEEALRRRLDLEDRVSAIAARLSALPSWRIDEGIESALASLGEATEVDRTYLILVHDDGAITYSHAWLKDGGEPPRADFDASTIADFPWLFPLVAAGETVHVPRVADLPPAAKAERARWTQLGVRSALCVPLRSSTRLLGVMGCVAARAEKSWLPEDARLMRLAGEVVAGALGRRRAEEELLAARKIESVGVLAGGIAHDFNNILTAILGGVALARGAASADEREAILGAAEHACGRAAALTKQLLTFARGGAPVRKTAAIAEIARESVEFALRGSPLEPSFRAPEDLWPADVDPGQISQVFQNLAINALQAARGSGHLRVEAANIEIFEDDTAPLPPGPYIRIRVADDGPGIPPELLPRIFDPYVTTKRDGNGLGLATSLSIVRRHGGQITVASPPGGGAVFTIFLPAARGKRPEKPTELEAPRGAGRVLVMDDDAAVRVVAAKMLTRLGYAAETVEDGAAAIARCGAAKDEGRPFDAVILDLTIPGGMGGAEAAAKLREVDPNVRAIVSSGYSNDPVMSEYDAHGFEAVVAKPYRLDELAAALRGVLAGH